MLVVFIIIGAYMINSKRNVMFSGDTQDAFKDSPSLSQFVSIFDLYYGVIIGCFALSLVLAVIFMVLLKNFPK